jgi:hypothetical protein
MVLKRSATCSQGIHGYISVMTAATVNCTYFILNEQCFVKNNCGTSVIGNVFISYDY